MMRLRDLSIGQRLGIGFALIFTVLAGLLGAVYYWQARSAASEEAFITRAAPLAQAAQDLENALLQAGIRVRAYLIRPGADTLRAHEESIARVRSTLAQLGALPKQGDGADLYARLLPPVNTYLEVAADVVDRERFGGALEPSLAGAREAAVGALNAFSALQRSRARAALSQIDEARSSTTRGLTVAAGLAVLLLGLLAVFIVRSIRGPANQLLGVASALQAGDWRPALAWAPKAGESAAPPARHNEMLKLGYAFGAAAVALERREQRLRADRAVAGAAAVSLDGQEIATLALQAICDYVGAEVGAYYMHMHDEQILKPVAVRALGGALHALAIGEGIPGRAAAELRAVAVSDIPSDSAFNVRLGYDAAPPRSVVAVPVTYRGELLGVLVVGSLRNLDAEAVAFLEAAGSQLGIGLDNVRAYEKIQQQSALLQSHNEELQAQAEEIQAQNEEIQAQNEELQAQGEEIQAQNEQLKEQTRRVQAYADSLAEADRRKSEFLGILAHELRNPMAAIANSLYTLTHSGKPEHRGRAEEVLGRQTRLLSRLVDDLLDVTRISSGKVQLQREQLNLAEIVSECAEDYRGAAVKARVRLDIRVPEGEVPVAGDRTRLCQIVGNLLDNAIKFAGADGQVSVVLNAPRAQGRAELRVADQGIGMDPGMLERLFQPFTQADTSLARRRSGLGLGLALTKALVELHGGSVEAHSAGLGKGAEFVVRLPVSEAQTRSAAAAVRPSAAEGRPRRILIIEDNTDAGLTLKDAMELAGHEARVAHDAEQGLAMAHEFQPDVLLCDIGLPGMDGYQLAQEFRADERLKSVFLIAVSGYAAPDDQQRAAQAGFDRHFGKPADMVRLHQVLAELDAGGAAPARVQSPSQSQARSS